MKTNKFFVAALSVALCMNFAACSDDEDNDLNPDNAKKRLVKVIERYDGGSYSHTTVYDLGYDAEGRVVSIYADSGKWFSCDITYSGNKAAARWRCPSEDEYEGYIENWELDDDGNIIRQYYEDEDDWEIKYTYTDGYMTKRVETCYDKDNVEHSYVSEDTFDWKDGLLVGMNGESNDLIYTDVQNVGNLGVCFGESIFDDDNDENALRMAGLCGNSFKKLPKEADVETFEYELDSDGYVKTMKVSNTGCSDKGWGNSTYTLTWEEIK